MPCAMPHDGLIEVLLSAYRCGHFDPPKRCPEAEWCPSEGHVPRGFLGASGELDDVELVMVLAEPGPPKGTNPRPEIYEHSGADPVATLEQVVRFVYGCYEEAASPPHSHARWFLEQRYGGMPFDEQLRRVWITEARLCSSQDKTQFPTKTVVRDLRSRIPQEATQSAEGRAGGGVWRKSRAHFGAFGVVQDWGAFLGAAGLQ